MEAIEKLSDIETGVCDDAHIYELSECMARMFEAVFNLYRVRITLQHMIISIRSKLQSTMLMGMASIQISL